MNRDKANDLTERGLSKPDERVEAAERRERGYVPLCVTARETVDALHARQAREDRVRELDEPHRVRQERNDIQAETIPERLGNVGGLT